MNTIKVTARFEVTFTKRVTDGLLAKLEDGVPIDQVIDESIPYRLAASEGTCEMEWAPVRKRKKAGAL